VIGRYLCQGCRKKCVKHASLDLEYDDVKEKGPVRSVRVELKHGICYYVHIQNWGEMDTQTCWVLA
jgi:hypothetical protein